MQALRHRRTVLKGGLVVSLLLVSTACCFAQSLGDVARQERDRKKDQPQRETHVYTNDDLEKPHILVPEDQARALAARTRNSLTPAPAVDASQPPVLAPPAAIPSQPRPVAVETVTVAPFPVSAPPPPESPAPDLSISGPEPQRPAQETSRNTARKVTVSSPSEWKVAGVGIDDKIPPPSLPVARKPSPAPARQPEAESTEMTRVRIERGDSLWKLAKRRLGSGAKWLELALLNPQLSNPDRIRAGAWIQVPADAKRSATQVGVVQVGVAQVGVVVVHRGDTLWSVAQTAFGNGSAFPCIAGANPQLSSMDRIHPGETLLLPQSCPQRR